MISLRNERGESEVKRIMELKAGNKNVAYGLK